MNWSCIYLYLNDKRPHQQRWWDEVNEVKSASAHMRGMKSAMVYVIYGNNGFLIRLCNVANLLLAFCAQWWDNSIERGCLRIHCQMDRCAAGSSFGSCIRQWTLRTRRYSRTIAQKHRASPDKTHTMTHTHIQITFVQKSFGKIMAKLLTMARWTHFNT